MGFGNADPSCTMSRTPPSSPTTLPLSYSSSKLLSDSPPSASSSPPSRTHTSPPSTYNERHVLPIASLTSIATVIGSGILALPVTLYNTPVPVFIIIFTIAMLAQIAVVCTIVELLQRARDEEADRALARSYDSIESTNRNAHVSLFSIAEFYLPNSPLRYLYFTTTFLCFITILVSYGLAGPQAVWQLISAGAQTDSPPIFVLIAYWAVGTAAVVFFVNQLLGVFGSFTVLKGALFVGVVFIVAMLPENSKVLSIQQLFSNYSGWANAAAPFLMSCVALGGVANTTPVTFNLLPLNATKAQVARYRAAIVIAVVICYLLNIGWVLAVLQVVPREAEHSKASLALSYHLGQISTVPLIAVLHEGHAVHGWVLKAVELIVELFIVVSTSVSFFVCAAGLKSFVDGAANSVCDKLALSTSRAWSLVPKAMAYLLSFGSVLAIVVANPDGFIAVLTRFASFTVNLQAGLLMFVMLFYCRTRTARRSSLITRRSSSDAGSSSDLPELSKLSPQTMENLMWEGRDEEDTTVRTPIPLELSTWLASQFITFGSTFFAFACFLALLGPMLGVKLDARE